MTNPPPRDNLRGGLWLVSDLSLNIWALSIVKAVGLDYGASQIVLLRAGIGLLMIAPFVVLNREAFRNIGSPWLHLLRVALSAVTLTASFFAISRVPLALFTAVNFTRPLVTMVMAALLLKEVIGPRQWVAAGAALIGVLIAVDPGAALVSPGLLALGVVVLAGCAAIIVTRRLRSEPVLVMMTFYTGGLAAVSAPFALVSWVPVPPDQILPLLLIGVFAQSAQFCFLRAHFHGDAGVLSVLSYLGLPLSVSVGAIVFGEVPDTRFWLGASLVVLASAWVTVWRRTPRDLSS